MNGNDNGGLENRQYTNRQRGTFAYPNGVGVTGRYVTESGGSQLACMERCVR